MSYRDDVDTLYTRAMVLQRELDQAREKLDARDAELAKLRGTTFEREDTSPGLVSLRNLPDARSALDRLVDTSRGETRSPMDLDLPPLPMPDWSTITEKTITLAPQLAPSTLLEFARDRLARLQAEDLVLVTKIIEQLTDTYEGMDEQLRARLRWLASEIALVERKR